MTFEFRPARRENVPLLIGLAGGTGSGKTFSAMLLAKGLAAGEPFYVVDTENGRAKHYADTFAFQHGELHEPFRPERYAEAIEAAEKSGAKVIVVDSMSHEWAGDGGMLDWHDDLMGGNEKKKLTAWIEPKMAHKRMVSRLLQLRAHVILCFRAEPKVDVVRDPKTGKMEIVPKASLTGLDGWLPITEKNLPYELTASFLLMADKPGVPRPIKLQEQHRPFFALDMPVSEESGRRLAEWAAGGEVTEPGTGGSGETGATTDPAPLGATPDSPPGSVTPWAELHKIAERAGLVEQVVNEAQRRFAGSGRTTGSLTAVECREIWDAVQPAGVKV